MMRRTEHRKSSGRPIKGYLWGVMAVVTCPCHLPVALLLIAGTSAGAVLSDHLLLAAVVLTPLFVLSFVMAWRNFAGRKK